MDNAALRQRLGAGALQLAHDWYSWEAAMEKTLRLFAPPTPTTPRMVPQSAR
jgi:hypothetical protein